MLANQKVQCDADPSFYLKYTDIRVGKPSVEEDLIISDITPQVPKTCHTRFLPRTVQACRLRDMTYAAPIMVDVEYIRGKNLVRRKGSFRIHPSCSSP
jgi:DNA-directed RNA polymerase III subunit RPC2